MLLDVSCITLTNGKRRCCGRADWLLQIRSIRDVIFLRPYRSPAQLTILLSDTDSSGKSNNAAVSTNQMQLQCKWAEALEEEMCTHTITNVKRHCCGRGDWLLQICSIGDVIFLRPYRSPAQLTLFLSDTDSGGSESNAARSVKSIPAAM